MNILFTINNKVINELIILVKSLILTHPQDKINIYIMHKSLTNQDEEKIKSPFLKTNINFNFIKIDNKEINQMPVYEKRYPVEIYFRLFAVYYLPHNLDRILYLDVDTLVINSLHELYNMDFNNNLFIGASHIKEKLHKINVNRFNVSNNYIYLNTGVLLMNLQLLRKIPLKEDIKSFLKNNKTKLILPDQDILFALYGNKVKEISSLKYNLGDREIRNYNLINKDKIDINWVRKNTVIIHYYGRNKPWHKNYLGILNTFYQDFVNIKIDVK